MHDSVADALGLKPIQLDALREVANIGAGHAATALSQMVGTQIDVSVPEISLLPREDVPGLALHAGDKIVAVFIRMMGDLTGQTVLTLPEPDARALADQLLGRPIGAGAKSLGEIEASAVEEVGNILASACMNALSTFMEMMLLPSVPSLMIDLPEVVLAKAHGEESKLLICAATRFATKGAQRALQGHFLIIPDTASLTAILEALKMQ